MKTFFVLSISILSLNLFAQSNLPKNLTGIHYTTDFQNNVKMQTNPLIYDQNFKNNQPVFHNEYPDSVASMTRYVHMEGAAIGNNCAISGNGLKSIVGWYLNQERTSCYGNANSTALWEFTLFNTPLYYNFVGVSSDGGAVASAFYQNIYLLNGSSGTQTWTFNLSTLPYVVNAGPVGITSTGNFIIATGNPTNATDTGSIIGFDVSSNVPVWTQKIGPTGTISAQFQGIKISGNDSLAIVNTYIAVYVIRTYTGQIIYTGSVNPVNNNGTQTAQAISGNGNIIATVNYIGYLRVLQWNGSTYNLLWQHQEPPGTYYNWMTAVDVSNDGSMVAAGTLNFLTSSTFDGKVKFFNISGGSTPVWTYTGCGDEVSGVAFSGNGRFLCASSWGDYYTGTANNLLVWKTTHPVNLPWYAVSSVGSFFSCSISNDGQTAIGSGKAVHARTFGSGGILYNLYIDTSETLVGINNNHNTVISNYSVSQNYPNPFNPSTAINYQIPKDGLVKLSVYDILGREVKELVNEYQKRGEYNVKFDAVDLPSGVYFYKLQSGDFTETKKMTLIK